MFTKLRLLMGLKTKGTVITGEGAKKRIVENPPSPQEIKVEENNLSSDIQDNTITFKEARFIISKLKQANYTGAEFEIFSEVILKLSKIEQ